MKGLFLTGQNLSIGQVAYVRQMKLAPLLTYLEQQPVQLDTHAQAIYHEIQRLKPTDALPLQTYLRFFEQVAQTLNAPQLGASVGLQAVSKAFLPLRELFLAAGTLHEALDELNHCTLALQGATVTRLQRQAGRVRVSYQISTASPLDYRQDAEFSLFMLLRLLRLRLGSDWCPDEVHFQHPVTNVPVLEQLFGCHLQGSSNYTGLVFNADYLEHVCPTPLYSEEVLDFFRSHVTELFAQLDGVGFVQRVEQVVNRGLGEGTPTLEQVSQQLFLSPRTVQRKLAQAQLTFSDLLSAVRQQAALNLMRDPAARVELVAEQLGYADAAAFSKAFKRWTGLSPLRYRQQFG